MVKDLHNFTLQFSYYKTTMLSLKWGLNAQEIKEALLCFLGCPVSCSVFSWDKGFEGSGEECIVLRCTMGIENEETYLESYPLMYLRK